jgi:hypothetical protein
MPNKRFLWTGLVLVFGLIAITIGTCSRRSSDVAVKDEINADGVRPDVADKIKRAFPDSERKRAAATQLARAFQLAVEKPERALEVNVQYERAQACMYAIEGVGHGDPPTETSTLIESWVVNSLARSRAYLRYNATLSGEVFEVIEANISSCDFDSSKMRN